MPEATYALTARSLPHAGLDHWVRGEDKRFVNLIAGRGHAPHALRAASTEMTRDLATNIRAFIALACAGGRCSTMIDEGDQMIARFLAARGFDYARRDREPTHDELVADPKSGLCGAYLKNGGVCHNYRWDVVGNDVLLGMSCLDAGNGDFSCRLFWRLPNGTELRYSGDSSNEQHIYTTGAPPDASTGKVAANDLEPMPHVRIEGDALALRRTR